MPLLLGENDRDGGALAALFRRPIGAGHQGHPAAFDAQQTADANTMAGERRRVPEHFAESALLVAGKSCAFVWRSAEELAG
jgi:hypothetical protein